MKQKDGKRKTLKRSVGLLGDVDILYDRVADILDRARANVVRSVNSEMVLAYWHIGREIGNSPHGRWRIRAFNCERTALRIAQVQILRLKVL